MTDINHVVLVGRVTKDTELRYMTSGTALCRFSLAVNRSFKKDNEWQDEVSFFDLTLFGEKASSLYKYLVKGTRIAVQGSLQQERWEHNGQKQSKVAVIVNSLQLLESRKDKEESTSRSLASKIDQAKADQSEAAYDFDNDIPF